MGKGDRRTRRGKIALGTSGKFRERPKKNLKNIVSKKTKLKPAPEGAEFVPGIPQEM